MNNKFKIILVALLVCSFTLFYSLSFADNKEDNVIRFDGYNKIGDTVKVINADRNTTFKFEVFSILENKIISSETNETGEFKIIDNYAESFVNCYLSSGEKLTMYVSNLPVIYINSNTDYNSVSQEEYTDINLNLTGNIKYTNSSYLYTGTGKIKVRGHSSASRDKKPFSLKLDTNSNLLNLGQEDNGKIYKSKHWVLLANDIDHTLMRNKLFYDFSGDIGFEYYFKSDNVSLIYNGEYMGVYQLCEQRRVDEGRVDITDWTLLGENISKAIANKEWINYGYENALEMENKLNDIMYFDYSWIDNEYVILNNVKFIFSKYGFDLPNTNGGYMAEIEFRINGTNDVADISTKYGVPIFFNQPEVGEDSDNIEGAISIFNKTSLYKNAKKYIQAFEYAVHSKNFVFNSGTHNYIVESGRFSKDTGWKSMIGSARYTDDGNDNKHYSELFDMNSLVNNFLFNELTNNFDAMKTSAFYYKEVNELAKMGPIWDLDMSLGNITMWNEYLWFPTDWQVTNEKFTYQYAYQSFNWYRSLIKDPYFLVKTYERYKEIRPIIENLIKKGGLIDQQAEYLYEAGLANDTRWGYTYNPEYYNGGQPLYFEDSIKSMKNFIELRMEWLDKQFKTVESLINSFGYYKDTSDITYSFNGNYLYIKSSNTLCNNVEVQVNGINLLKVTLKNGEALVSIPKKYLNTNSKLNVIVIYEKNGEQYILNKDLKPSSNYEYIARSKYLYFKTNDKFVDNDILNDELEDILEESKYTIESWEQFINIYFKAKKVLSDDKSMQKDIDNVIKELKEAKLKLEIKSNDDVVGTPGDDNIISVNTPSDDYNGTTGGDVIDEKQESKKDYSSFILILCGIGIVVGVIVLILNNKKKTSN